MSDEFIAVVIVIAIIAGLVFVGVLIEKSHDDKLWNNGHCECGGTWEYEQAVGHRSSTNYIYICDKCGERIEMFKIVR